MSQLQHIFAHDNTPLLAFLHMPKQLVLAIFILKEESYYYYVTLKILSYFCDLCFLQFVNRPTQHSSVLIFTWLSRVDLTTCVKISGVEHVARSRPTSLSRNSLQSTGKNIKLVNLFD